MEEHFSEPEPNVIESSAGFSVRVLGRTGLRYTEGGRSVRIDSEVLATPQPPTIAMFKDSIRVWEDPANPKPVTDEERDTIASNIKRAFESCGYGLEIHGDFDWGGTALRPRQAADPGSSAWTTTDAWMLAAIAHDRSPKGHTLTEVITVADAINHDVPTEADFTKAIRRLLAAGLIGADPQADRYWPTKAGADFRKRWRGGQFDWANTILPQLERLGMPQDTDWSLPEGMFDQAVHNHLGKWSKRT